MSDSYGLGDSHEQKVLISRRNLELSASKHSTALGVISTGAPPIFHVPCSTRMDLSLSPPRPTLKRLELRLQSALIFHTESRRFPRINCFPHGVSLPEELPQDAARSPTPEGAAVTVTINRYERDPLEQPELALRITVAYATPAASSLQTFMGLPLKASSNVHHVTPIASIKSEYELDPIRDLRPLCSNCHAVAHLRSEPYSIEELQNMLTKERKNG